jgi:uncharacterized protein with GYD domain
MPLYVGLVKWTDQGVKRVNDDHDALGTGTRSN